MLQYTYSYYQLLLTLKTYNPGPQVCIKYVIHFIGFYRRASYV